MCVPLKVQEQDLIRPWKENDCEYHSRVYSRHAAWMEIMLFA